MSQEQERLTASDVRRDFSNVINRVSYTGERVVVRRGKRDVAAVVSMDDYLLLERLSQERRDKGIESHAG